VSSRKNRKLFSAQGMVEFALVGPLFFLILLGTIEMGRLMWVNHELTNGTREGARWAAVRGAKSGENINNTDVRAIILDRTSAIGNGLTVTLTWSPDREPGSQVTVATTYPYQPMVGGFLGIGTINLSRQSSMTVHY